MTPADVAWNYFDVETGGFSRKKDALLEIGWSLLDKDFKPITGDAICIWPEPGFEVSEEAANVNGFSKEAWEERQAVSLAEATERVNAALTPYAHLPKIAHNAFSMDKPWIEQYFPALCPAGVPWFCTMDLLRKYFKAQNIPIVKGSLTLDNLCKVAGYHRVDRHSAMEDAYAGSAGARWLQAQGMKFS